MGEQPPRGPPKWTPQKSNFFMAQARVPVLYDIRRYLTDKYFDILYWGYPPVTPQKSMFSTPQLGVPVCFDISRYLTNKYFDIVWG